MSTQSLEDFMGAVQRRDPNQPEFLQAVREVMVSLWPFLDAHPKYRDYGLLQRLARQIMVVRLGVQRRASHERPREQTQQGQASRMANGGLGHGGIYSRARMNRQ